MECTYCLQICCLALEIITWASSMKQTIELGDVFKTMF